MMIEKIKELRNIKVDFHRYRLFTQAIMELEYKQNEYKIELK
jgi:hypothetical protein